MNHILVSMTWSAWGGAAVAGKSSKGGERLLTLRGNVWWFRQQVPKTCRPVVGKPWLLVNLHTSNVVEAKRRRDDLEASTRLQFRQITAGKRTDLSLTGWVSAHKTVATNAAGRGALYREALKSALDDDESELIIYVADAEHDSLKPSQRGAFEGAFVGRVEVDHHIEAFLSKADLAPKTVNERRGLVGRFARWCHAEAVKLDRVDRRVPCTQPRKRST
jgi:hypothetical protein